VPELNAPLLSLPDALPIWCLTTLAFHRTSVLDRVCRCKDCNEYIPNETKPDLVPRNDSHEGFDPAMGPSTNPPTDPDHTATTTSNRPQPHPRSNHPQPHPRRTNQPTTPHEWPRPN